MKRFNWVLGITIALGWTGISSASAPDNLVLVVNSTNATGGSASLGAYGYYKYDDGTEVFYVGAYGSGGQIRKVVLNANGTVTSDQYVSSTDWALYITAVVDENVDHIYLGHPDYKGNQQYIGGLLLNPQTLAIGNTTYAPGAISFIFDAPTPNLNSSDYDNTKRVYRYDLRQVGTVTTELPDYADASYIYAGDLAATITGSLGIVDWNDVFATVLTKGEKASVSGASGTGTDNWGRQSAWSSDGQYLYQADAAPTSGNLYGGIWKINASTGETKQIYQSNGIYSEVGVVHTSLRRLNPDLAADGDQILFEGNAAFNDGGISYLIDDGETVSGPYTLFTVEELGKYFETNGKNNGRKAVNGADPGVNPSQAIGVGAITIDSDGTIYFATTGTAYNLWRYDTEGRLASLRDKEQQYLFSSANGKTSPANVLNDHLFVRNTTYTNSDGLTFDIKQILSRTVDLKGICGIYDFKTGDFNRDNEVTAEDIALLKSALATPIATFSYVSSSTTYYYEAPAASDGTLLQTSDPDAYVDYLKFDLNGNGLVTDKDVYILSQFYSGLPGDANLDGKVDVGDLGILAANYGGTDKTWTLGDFNNDGVVDVGDLGILAANYGHGTSGADFAADYEKVFGTATEATAEKASETETDSSSICSTLGLSLVAGLAVMGLMLVKLEE